MLRWIDGGEMVEAIPRARTKFYERGKQKLSFEEFRGLTEYVNDLLDGVMVKSEGAKHFFVPGWQAPGSWEHTPLDIVWEKVYPGNKVDCALWYGLLVMETIIDRPELWFAVKSNFSRDFDQTVYWTEVE